MKSWRAVLVGGMVTAFAFAQAAFALPVFRKAFEERYVKNNANAAFVEQVKKEGCNVCHVKGESKEVRNAYGNVLAELIPDDAQERLKAAGDSGKAAEEAKLLKELEEAFTKTEKRHVNGKDGETFGERLKAGKLPGGE